jgi:hypothetical protein
MSWNPCGKRLYVATPLLVYALKWSLAIDGKAMYFGDGNRPPNFRLRTLNA